MPRYRMFTPRQQTWEHCIKDMNHLLLYGYDDPKYEAMREHIATMQSWNLTREQIVEISYALQQAYIIGRDKG